MSRKKGWIIAGGVLVVLAVFVAGAIHFIRPLDDRQISGNSSRTERNVDQYGFENLTLNEVNVCRLDTDCILVEAGVCGLSESIHRDHQQLWQQRQEWLIEKEGLVMCQPAIPREMFEPQCVNTRCEAVMLQDRAVLEFEDLPLLGQPAKLSFSFIYSEDKTDVEAVIHLPDGIQLLEGEPVWRGDLPQLQEKVLELTIQVQEAGHYLIEGSLDFAAGYPLKAQDSVELEVTPQATYLETRPVNHWEQRIGYAVPAKQEQLSSEIIIKPKPALGETFTITYRVTPLFEVYPLRMQSNLILPQNAFEVISVKFPQEGEASQNGMEFIWMGSPRAGEVVEIQLVLKTISTGWGPGYGTTFIYEKGITDTLMFDLYGGEYAGGYTIREP